MRFDPVLAALVTFVVALCAVVVYATVQADKACQAAGGHSHTVYSNGVTYDGKPVQTSTTQCLTADGRVIE